MFFKRPVNINFITILPVVLLLCLLAGLSSMMAVSVTDDIGTIGLEIESLRESADNVAGGWGMLLYGMTGALGSILVVLCWVVAAAMIIIVLLLFIPLLAARLVYRNAGGRLLAYRIIMGVEYIFLFLFILLLISLIADMVIPAVILVPVTLFTGAALVLNVVNTYSDRIKRY